MKSKSGRRVWLINLFGTPCSPSSLNPDNSLASLAANLKEAGYHPEIFDYQTLSFCSELVPTAIGNELARQIQNISEDGGSEASLQGWRELNQKLMLHQEGIVKNLAHGLFRRIETEKPLFIGLKLYSGAGQQLTLKLVEELRRRGADVPFVGGGPLVRIIGSNYLRLYPQFDFILDGEADHSIVALANLLEGNKQAEQVAGLMYRGAGGRLRSNPIQAVADLNDLPDPLYSEEVYPSLYLKNEKAYVFQIDESRGCPNACHFCVHPVINGRKIRCFEPSRIVGLMTQLQKQFGASAFRFTGSNTPQKFLTGLADEVSAQGLNVHYSCYASVNMTKPQVLKALVDTGMVGIFIGIETLDEKVLKQMFNKPQGVEKAKQLVGQCLEQGLYTTTSWMYPAPAQGSLTRSKIVDYLTQAYAGRSLDEGSVMVVPSLVLPSTQWFSEPQKFGFKLGDRDQYLRQYAEMDFSLHRPRQLLGSLDFRRGDEDFNSYVSQCDGLITELKGAKIPLSITDDWMLMGKLSGLPMAEFRDRCVHSFVTGDYSEMAKIVAQINDNTKAGYWPTLEAQAQAA